MKIIGKLALKSPPLVDLEHFLVRLSKAKRICLNGSSKPAVVEIVNELLHEKLKSEIEEKQLVKAGSSPTFYEFGYSEFLRNSDKPELMTFSKL